MMPDSTPSSTHSAPPVIVIGASAGGLEALDVIWSGLPEGFPAAICVVLHIPAWRSSFLPAVLSSSGRTPVEPVNHQPLAAGRVYVAPADHHLIIDDGEFLVWHGPKENSH